MKSKGGISIEQVIWAGVFLFVVGAVLYGVGSKAYGEVYDLANLIPGGKDVEIEVTGVSRIGIDLTDDLRVKYWDGGSWVPVSLDEEKFVLNKKEVDREYFKDKLSDFYFNTPRKGNDSVSVSESDVLKLQIVPHFDGSLIRHYPEGETITGAKVIRNYGFGDDTRINIPLSFESEGVFVQVVEDKGVLGQGENLFVDLFGRVYEIDGEDVEFSFLRTEEYSSPVMELIGWMDQILQGEKYEKFINLEYDQIVARDVKEKVIRDYKVQRIDYILFVDFNEPVAGGAVDKYFGRVAGSGESGGEKVQVNNAQIKISFDLLEGVKGVYWGSPSEGCVKGWYVLTYFDEYLPAFSEGAGEFKMSGSEQKDFTSGLEIVVERLDRAGFNDYNNVKINDLLIGDGQIDSAFGGEQEEFKKEAGRQFNKGVIEIAKSKLSEYNLVNPFEDVNVDKLIIESVSPISLPFEGNEMKRVVVTWENKGDGFAWYVGENLINAVGVGSSGRYNRINTDFPSFYFTSEEQIRSFDEGLPLIIDGLRSVGWVSSDDGKTSSFLSYYPELDVKIIFENGQEVDISDKVNLLRKRYGSGGGGGVARKTSPELEKEETKRTAEIIFDYYDLVQKGAGCF